VAKIGPEVITTPGSETPVELAPTTIFDSISSPEAVIVAFTVLMDLAVDCISVGESPAGETTILMAIRFSFH
jgi:hypothetical protein